MDNLDKLKPREGYTLLKPVEQAGLLIVEDKEKNKGIVIDSYKWEKGWTVYFKGEAFTLGEYMVIDDYDVIAYSE